ncbi:hypothetical protein LSH36_671g01001, partial [Paralvinella palmiformis]
MAPIWATVVASLLLIWPCSTENIAFNKSTYQIGRYGNGSSDKAVDGQYDKENGGRDYYLSVCARPNTDWNGNVPAVWSVDLEDIYSISNVNIYNTYDNDGPLINIQLTDKSTNQTGTFGGLTSDKAVDGRLYYPTDDQRYCAHPLNFKGQPVEWWIDLGEMYKIHSVTLYNTGNPGGYYRMENFVIRVYSPRVQSSDICVEYPGEVGPAANITLPCRHNTYGQYVQFIRLGGRDINVVTICEVEIKGQLYSGCPYGYYGDICDQHCGMCSDIDPDIYNPCDITGSCINGCQMWWITDNCQTEIVKPNNTGQQISLKTSSSDTIQLFLEQVDVPSGVSEYYGYKITYCNDDKNQYVNHDDKNTTITVTLTGLNYNTEYQLKVEPYRIMKGVYDNGDG